MRELLTVALELDDNELELLAELGRTLRANRLRHSEGNRHVRQEG